MNSYEPYSPPPATRAEGGKRLIRSRDDKMLGGVCGGLAAYVGADANVIRIVLVVATLFGFGTGILLYLLAWWLMPQA